MGVSVIGCQCKQLVDVSEQCISLLSMSRADISTITPPSVWVDESAMNAGVAEGCVLGECDGSGVLSAIGADSWASFRSVAAKMACCSIACTVLLIRSFTT
eukprot:scaffold15588_cov24-Tisochrysis_lutea.AAC.1